MTDIIIFIHGAKAINSQNKIIQNIISIIYKHLFNFIPKYNEINPWKNTLIKNKYKLIEVNWNGKIIPYEIPKISKKVIDIIQSNKKKI